MNSLLKSINLCKEQKDRIRKSIYQSFYLLESKIVSNNIELYISGSTLNVYEIKIADFSIKCNCPDYYRTTSRGLFCKHICFVIITIGKIFDEDVFIKQIFFLDYRIMLMIRLSNNCGGDPNIINSTFIDRFNKVISKETDKSNEEVLIRNIEEDCPICYVSLKEPVNVKIYNCMKCLNAVHKTCFDMWMSYNKSCIFCRSVIIINSGNSKVLKYLNIS